MSAPFKLACVQTTSGREIGANIAAASDLARRARDAGADLIGFPETVNMMETKSALARDKAAETADDAALAAFRALAGELRASLLVGSLVVWSDAPADADGRRKLANRSFLIDADGAVVAHYDKIHMFDVDLGGGEVYRESASYAPGGKVVIAETPWGHLGMTICYDMRFPHLYRRLAQDGAEFISAPSAFTRPSGRAHWHVLLRARAIETGCYVFAPAQCGDHEGGRKTYGHSLIIDPWGDVLADAGEAPGFVIADIDPAKVTEARERMPSLRHDRDFV